ncbi:TonB-dependent receptor [Novosphingobium sp.]|uniref:TonB-dependent receptor n=1 Tax=Novosphingobium sp. TaxID=1874826 RepID=UPI0035AFBBCA
MPSSKLLASACLFALILPMTAQAQETPSDQEQYHAHDDNDIVVTATLPASRQDALSGVAVLRGEELTGSLRPSIGDTLAHTPGVTATSFGPSASRPVLRGLQGERVRVLSNGIGSIDVSNTSVDHAPAVNPVLAQRVEVLRGPQSLQYGSAAIGGVVNVIDKRIPTAVPDEPVHLTALAGYGSAASERTGAMSMEVPLGGGWVGHVDGSYMKTDDLKIGGYALTPELRATALASSLLPPDPSADPAIDFAANAAIKGRLPNSASKTWSVGGGAAYINDNGNIGVAYSHFDSLYGIPVRFAVEPGQTQEAPRLQIRQDRIDARAELNFDGAWLEKASFRYAYGDYSHYELATDGSVGTSFYNKAMEGRLEFAQANRGGWKGASGLQFMNRAFNVVGDEAFLPRNNTSQVGVFTLQQFETGAWKFEAGARYEHSSLEAKPLASQPQFVSGKTSYDAFSAAIGAAYDFAPEWKFGVNLSRAERSPSAEELFANGPHAGTEAFEIGNPTLKKEVALSAEGILRGSGNDFSFEASAFYTRFNNFVYEDRTGAFEDGLPVYQVRQSDARLYGFEVQGNVVFARPGNWALSVDGLADYVHADIDNAGPAPRIPPLRFLGGLRAKSPRLDVGVEAEHVTTQNRVAAYETTTPGYTMVNAEVTYRPMGHNGPLSFVLSANNLFNVDARRAASYLKDYAPLAGRDFRITARLEI